MESDAAEILRRQAQRLWHYQWNNRIIAAPTTALTMDQLRKAAIDGNATMLIWMGKQTMGQRDKPEGDDISEPLPVQITIQVEDATKQEEV